MKKKLLQNIYNGNYLEAEAICLQSSKCDIEKFLYEISSETQNLSLFSFVQYMVEKTNGSFWVNVSYSLIFGYFIYVEGILSIGLHNAREDLFKEHSLNKLSNLLLFANGPESIISTDELKKIIKEIKTYEPNFDDKLYSGFDIDFDDTVYNFIFKGFYGKAEEIIRSMSILEQKSKFICLVGKYESFVVYDFIRYMIKKTKEKYLHEVAIDVLNILKDQYPSMEGFQNLVNYHLRESSFSNNSTKL